MSGRHKFIKFVLKGCGIYFIYNIFDIIHKERVLE